MQEELLSTQRSSLSPSHQMEQMKVFRSTTSLQSLALAYAVVWPEYSVVSLATQLWVSLATGWSTLLTKASSKLTNFFQEHL